ncbi:hypothetical protein N7471_002429 [Penicillium samsonianum]|uniref:uncharacterized protein n=1 Tax=Penicillium samsonianum TaxID=1882272 RepID=UPI0025478717|nr:uncharacterized protein N7471_002429 [Penicillium samsonianum]KAJ6142976.1 hypothetical protein N7471_002429 [Penicillium samsonianum]
MLQIRGKGSSDAAARRASRLEERIALMEKLLVDTLAAGGSGSKPSNYRAMVGEDTLPGHQCFFSLSGRLNSKDPETGTLHPYNGTAPSLSEVQKSARSLIGYSVNLQDLSKPSLPWQRHGPDRSHRDPPMEYTSKLPDISFVNECVASYYSSPTHLSFPIISRPHFRGTINLAYQNSSNSSFGTASARACVCAFLSLSEVWNLHVTQSPSINSPALIKEAERYINQIAQEETIDGLQAALMLMIFHCSSGDFRPALYLNSLIARLIFRLGVHLKHPPVPDGAISFVTDEIVQKDGHLRNLFWTAYALDKELSLRTGQPPAINDEDCDLTLPPGYEEQLNTLLSSAETEDMIFKGHLYPSDLRLIKIKSRAYSAFYRPGAIDKSDIELLKSIRELDDDLEKWRLSLPPKHRPTLFIFQQISTGNAILDMHFLIVRMDYHHCMAIIHQASGRCKAWAGNHNNAAEGVGSSFTLAVETSRSSLLSLQSSLHVLPNGTFWYVLMFRKDSTLHPPLLDLVGHMDLSCQASSCLVIFCNILFHPLGVHARRDLELLSLTATLVKSLPLPPRVEPLHVARVQGLLTELSGLAKLAIAESQNQLLLLMEQV